MLRVLSQRSLRRSHMERGAQRRFSARTTKMRGYCSMTSFPIVSLALLWRSRFFRSPSRQNPRTVINLGKTIANPFIIAISTEESGSHAKPGDLQPAVWEKHLRNRLLWRFPQKKAELSPNPATRGGLGEIRNGTGLSWRFPQEKRCSRQTRRPSTLLGKFPAEPVYFGDRETKRDPIGEAARTRHTPSSKFGTIFVLNRTRHNPEKRNFPSRLQSKSP